MTVIFVISEHVGGRIGCWVCIMHGTPILEVRESTKLNVR